MTWDTIASVLTREVAIPFWIYSLFCIFTGFAIGQAINFLNVMGFFIKVKNLFKK